MEYIDIKSLTYYKYFDPATSGTEHLIFVVGRDAFTSKFVATCQDWLNGVDILEDDDIHNMEEI